MRDQLVQPFRQRARHLTVVDRASVFTAQQAADAGVDPRRIVLRDTHRSATPHCLLDHVRKRVVEAGRDHAVRRRVPDADVRHATREADTLRESEFAGEPLKFRAVRPVADDCQLSTRIDPGQLANGVIKRLVAVEAAAKQDQEVGVAQAELLAQRRAIFGTEFVSIARIRTDVHAPARLRLKLGDLLGVLTRRHQDLVSHARRPPFRRPRPRVGDPIPKCDLPAPRPGQRAAVAQQAAEAKQHRQIGPGALGRDGPERTETHERDAWTRQSAQFPRQNPRNAPGVHTPE